MPPVYADQGGGFKRPRMDGPGFGMPGPGGYGAPGMQGPGMEHHGGPGPFGMGDGGYGMGPGHYGGPMGGPMGGMGPGRVFPCVKLRGLPFDVAEDDIRGFLVRSGVLQQGEG